MPRPTYNLELLKLTVEKNNVVLGEYPEKLNYNSTINFTCECGDCRVLGPFRYYSRLRVLRRREHSMNIVNTLVA